MIQSGSLASEPGSQLPQNMRVISNFFRTAPDGTVRAFSSPIVHERYSSLDYQYTMTCHDMQLQLQLQLGLLILFVFLNRNKNATTASRHMGMPVPERPYALVLGSHEDDVSMTDGLKG